MKIKNFLGMKVLDTNANEVDLVSPVSNWARYGI